MDPEHRWNNIEFYNHTGLEKYPNYMMGGGYIVSGDVAAALVSLHEEVGLKFTPIEDATFGFWLSAMDLRQVDHPKIYAWGTPCCFRRIIKFKCSTGAAWLAVTTPPAQPRGNLASCACSCSLGFARTCAARSHGSSCTSLTRLRRCA